MGTRSVIAVMHGSNAKAVYCHWDGYLEHNGAILQKYYDSAQANHLVSLGDITSLKETVGKPHPFSYIGTMPEDEYKAKYGTMTTFYGRDRDEKNCEFKTLVDYEAFIEYFENVGAEYAYIMKEGEWFMFDCNNKNIRLLAEELSKNNIVV
jgi:hypothetical protein